MISKDGKVLPKPGPNFEGIFLFLAPRLPLPFSFSLCDIPSCIFSVSSFSLPFFICVVPISFQSGPNGASLRPNSAMLQEVVRNFRGPNVTIYRLPKGSLFFFVSLISYLLFLLVPSSFSILFPLLSSSRRSHLLFVLLTTFNTGIKIPSDLVLLHEHSNHYSLQCNVPMTLAGVSCWSFFSHHKWSVLQFHGLDVPF